MSVAGWMESPVWLVMETRGVPTMASEKVAVTMRVSESLTVSPE